MNYITGSPALISVVIPLRVRLLSPRGKGFIVKWWHKSPHLSALLLLKYYFMGCFFSVWRLLLSFVVCFYYFFSWILNGTKSTRIYKCRWGSWDKHSLQKCCWAPGLAPACRHQVVLLKGQACILGPVEEKSFLKKDVSKIKDLLCSLLMDYRAAVKAHSRLFHSFKLKQTAPSPPSFAVFVLDYFSSCAYIHISPAQFDHTLCF